MDVNSLPRKPRVLIGKVGLDGHNRGAYVVAYGLRQLGFEVIYTGLRQTSAAIAQAAVQEDVDVIGISSMVGAHLSVVKKLKAELEKLNAQDIPITIGGIIPKEDYAALEALGVKKVFPTGTTVKEIAEFVGSLVAEPAWKPAVPGTLEGKSLKDLYMVGTFCSKCGKTYFPKRRNCPRCLDDQDVKTIPLSRTGTLQAFSLANAAPPGYKVPHAQAYVDLGENGPRIFTLLTDYDASKLRVGCQMELKCVETRRTENNEAIIAYRFRPL
jgi:methylmalonyl-CoA mutase C-terminal domain/subunit